jgi:hypothetical protein
MVDVTRWQLRAYTVQPRTHRALLFDCSRRSFALLMLLRVVHAVCLVRVR